MPLKIELKPGEKCIVSGAVITNGGTRRSELVFENKVAILREKEIMRPGEANTPCKNLYFTVQLMYIDRDNLDRYSASYASQISEIMKAAPSLADTINIISKLVTEQNFYKALAQTKTLIEIENKLLEEAISASHAV
jgi:flagellar biosynthesis repressor protein FlbT